MIRWALAAVALTGCDALFDLDHLHGPRGDGGGESEIDPDSLPPNDGRICIGHFLSVCPPVSESYVFGVATTIDTSSDPRCMVIPASQDYPEVCVIGGTAITVGANVVVTGSRALVFAAIKSITVTQAGVIDASSTRIGQSPRRGPAANAAMSLGCTASSGDAQMTSGAGGAGGGAGGSFGGTGGAGGMSDKATSVNSNPAVGATPALLRGGCAGGVGGESASSNSNGPPGDSGGALLLVAGEAITIVGVVMANGGGGGGGTASTIGEHAGGGGGGSGGMIVLDAKNISALGSGFVVAGGAGGGGGADAAFHGSAGNEWTISNPLTAPTGGMGGGGAGNGGRSTASTIVDGGPGDQFGGTAGGGAGGGGGGAGLILVRGTVSQGSQIYPAPRTLQ
jgi:hypothetical protein